MRADRPTVEKKNTHCKLSKESAVRICFVGMPCLVSGRNRIIGRIAAAVVSGPEHLDKFASRLGGGGAAVEQLYEPTAYDDTRGV